MVVLPVLFLHQFCRHPLDVWIESRYFESRKVSCKFQWCSFRLNSQTLNSQRLNSHGLNLRRWNFQRLDFRLTSCKVCRQVQALVQPLEYQLTLLVKRCKLSLLWYLCQESVNRYVPEPNENNSDRFLGDGDFIGRIPDFFLINKSICIPILLRLWYNLVCQLKYRCLQPGWLPCPRPCRKILRYRYSYTHLLYVCSYHASYGP